MFSINGIAIDTARYTTPIAIAGAYAEAVKAEVGKAERRPQLKAPLAETPVAQLADALRAAFKVDKLDTPVGKRDGALAFDGITIHALQEGLAKSSAQGAIAAPKAEGFRPPPEMPEKLAALVDLDAPLTDKALHARLTGTALEHDLLAALGYQPDNVDLRALKKVSGPERELYKEYQTLAGKRAELVAAKRDWIPDYQVRDIVALPQGFVALSLAHTNGAPPEVHYVNTKTNTFEVPPPGVVDKGYMILASTKSGTLAWLRKSDDSLHAMAPPAVRDAVRKAPPAGFEALAKLEGDMAAVFGKLEAGDAKATEQLLRETRWQAAGLTAPELERFASLLTTLTGLGPSMKTKANDLYASDYKSRFKAVNDKLPKADQVSSEPSVSQLNKRIVEIAKKTFTADSFKSDDACDAALERFNQAIMGEGVDLISQDMNRFFEERIALAQQRTAEPAFFKAYAKETQWRFSQGSFTSPGATQAVLDQAASNGVCMALSLDWALHGDLPKNREGERAITTRHMTLQAAHDIHLGKRGVEMQRANQMKVELRQVPQDPTLVKQLAALEADVSLNLPTAWAKHLGARPVHTRVLDPNAVATADAAGFKQLIGKRKGDFELIVALGRRTNDDDEGGGHAVALRRRGERIEFFDANVGAFVFDNEAAFLKFVDAWHAATYAKPWRYASPVEIKPA